MKKKKVAILLPWMKMGGTNKIAVNFMRELQNYCDVTLILSENSGELLSDIPDGVEIIIDSMNHLKTIVQDDVRKFHFIHLIHDAIYYAKIKLGLDNVDNYRYLVGRHSLISTAEFDCAISYHGQSPERLLNLLYRIRAKKKIAWIHGEMSQSKEFCKRLEKYYQKLDACYFVSNPTRESFLKMIDFDRNRTEVYYNPIDRTEIEEKSNEALDIKMDEKKINIVTVGRISKEKGQDMIPEIVFNLKNHAHNVQWFVVGDGPNIAAVQQLVSDFNVENEVKFLGVKKNPFNYIKQCDIYVQPSYTEGYSTTICEAGILGKAIIGTIPSGGIKDQITDGKNGLIVEATVDGLTSGIIKLIEDESLRHQFEKEILKKNFEGKGEIQKFLDFLG